MSPATAPAGVSPQITAVGCCSWCGAASGRPGVTFRKIREGVTGKVQLYLCPPCTQEHAQFGRIIPFKGWLMLYIRYWWHELTGRLRQLWPLLNPATHVREVRAQYRFRARGQKVRA